MLKSAMPLYARCLGHLRVENCCRSLASVTAPAMRLVLREDEASVSCNLPNIAYHDFCISNRVDKRFQHSAAVKGGNRKQGFLSRLLESTGFKAERMRYQKSVLKVAGCNLYVCLTTFVNYDEFMKEFGLPDTLNSWFRVNELHMWLTSVRLMQEAADGTFMRKCFVEAMWEDMTNRVKYLGDTSAAHRRKSIGLLHTQFKASLLAYDEGLLGDDHVLAGAIWRTFFEMDCEDIRKVERLVVYIRRQLAYLELQDSTLLLKRGLLPFLELNQESESTEKIQAVLTEIEKRNVSEPTE